MKEKEKNDRNKKEIEMTHRGYIVNQNTSLESCA